MNWLDILKTPLFWMLSALGSLVLSVVANMLTPRVSRVLSRYFDVRSSRLLARQEVRRQKVRDMHHFPERRLAEKLNAVFTLLMAVLVMCIAVPFASIPLTLGPSTSLHFLRVLGVFLYCVIGLIMFASALTAMRALDKMLLTFLADARDEAERRFIEKAKSDSTSSDSNSFLIAWDEKHFGVSTKVANSVAEV